MKLNKSKEWYKKMAEKEGDHEIGAGHPTKPYFYVVAFGRNEQTELICKLLSYEGITYHDWTSDSDNSILRKYYKGSNPVVVISRGPIVFENNVKVLNGFWALVEWFLNEGMVRC